MPASTILGQSGVPILGNPTVPASTILESMEYLLGTRAVPASTIFGQSVPSADTAVVATTTSSRVSSGSNSPVRKISAQQFEKRGQTLRRMVTTVDGVPSFLAAGGTVDLSGGPSGSTASWRRRSELKSVDSCELMNELILDICNDLDVTSLSHKVRH